MRVALVQMQPELGDLEGNLASACRLITRAREGGADLVVLPELCLTGYAVGRVDDDLALPADHPSLLALAAASGDAGVLLGFQEDSGRSSHNSAAYYEGGLLRHVHRKLYLPTYGIFDERKHFSPGQAMRAFTTRWGRMATLICNDAWQPQLPFLAVQDGAQVLLVPTSSAQSLFPQHYDSESYWRDLTRFYGRMYQSYVVFVNRVGSEGDLHFWGGSHVVDPWGQVIAEAEDGETVLLAEIDLARVRRRRREVPLVREARLALLAREIHRLVDEGGDL
ncbi:MAG: amidohydrolase [Euzebyaceae bacterium]|jgi:predicted amidohydrolase|nr:amidohydrolase [Euzebyaceae bacterium]